MTIGQVLWDLSPGAEYYTVKGVTQQGLTVSCTTNDTYCPLYNMVCGQMYTINVTAHNHVCQGLSTSTESVNIVTGELNRRCYFQGVHGLFILHKKGILA